MRSKLFWRGAWTAAACGALALASGCSFCGGSASGQAAGGTTPIYDAQSGQPVDYATTSTASAYAADPYADAYTDPYASGAYGQPAYTEPAAYNTTAAYTAPTQDYYQPAATQDYYAPAAAATYAAPAPQYETYGAPAPQKPAKAKKGKARAMSGAELAGIVNGSPPNHVLYVGTSGPYHEVQYSGKGVYEVPAGEVAFRRQFVPGAGTPYLITPYELTAGGVAGYSAQPQGLEGVYTVPSSSYYDGASYPTSSSFSSTTISSTTTVSPGYTTDATYPAAPASDPFNQPYYTEPAVSSGDSSTGAALAASYTAPTPSYTGGLIPFSDTY